MALLLRQRRRCQDVRVHGRVGRNCSPGARGRRRRDTPSSAAARPRSTHWSTHSETQPPLLTWSARVAEHSQTAEKHCHAYLLLLPCTCSERRRDDDTIAGVMSTTSAAGRAKNLTQICSSLLEPERPPHALFGGVGWKMSAAGVGVGVGVGELGAAASAATMSAQPTVILSPTPADTDHPAYPRRRQRHEKSGSSSAVVSCHHRARRRPSSAPSRHRRRR